jgi:hypothetical protein
MSIIKPLIIPALACILLFILNAGGYIVFPEDLGGPSLDSKGWSAVATNVGKSDAGDLHIDLTIRNETADWSAMQTIEGKPAVLIASDGKTTNCDTVFVSTGGHRLAPGFHMRGYTTGKKAEPTTQLIYVECKGAEAASGSKLSINYSYVTGQYNYYEREANKVDTTLEVNLDQVAADLKYPIAAPVDGLIQPSSVEMLGLNKVVVTLTDVTRTDKGLQFTWQTNNPSTYPSYVHIGNPPVIGEDGIFYGYYESPDIATVPLTSAGETAEWTTEVAVPADVKGFYIMLSVEAGKQRLFANYAIDITDK